MISTDNTYVLVTNIVGHLFSGAKERVGVAWSMVEEMGGACVDGAELKSRTIHTPFTRSSPCQTKSTSGYKARPTCVLILSIHRSPEYLQEYKWVQKIPEGSSFKLCSRLRVY